MQPQIPQVPLVTPPTQPLPPAELEARLALYMVPDTVALEQNRQFFLEYVKGTWSVGQLMQQIQSSQNPGVRQVAATLLRKSIITIWYQLPPAERAQHRASMLSVLVNDPIRLVQHNMTWLVSTVSKADYPSDGWPELLPFLFQCTQSPQPTHRRMAMNLFSSLTDGLGNALREHFGTLQKIFMGGLVDQDLETQVASLRAVKCLTQWLETTSEMNLFLELLGPIMGVIRRLIQQGEEDTAVNAFEIFDDVAESDTPARLMSKVAPPLVQFFLEIAANRTLQLNTRDKAMEFFVWMSKHKPKIPVLTARKPKILAKKQLNLVGPILDVIFPICAEPEPEEDLAEDEPTPNRVATQVIGHLGANLPSKLMFPLLFGHIARCAQAADCWARHAALSSVSILAQGLSERMRESLSTFLPWVFAALGDANPKLRSTACIALSAFAEHLQPEIYDPPTGPEVLKRLVAAMDDPLPAVQEKACFAIELFCEHMGPALRIKATETVGMICEAMGKAAFGPYLGPFMELALAGMQIDCDELREFTYSFFGNAAHVFQEDFGQYMPVVLPHFMHSFTSTSGVAYHRPVRASQFLREAESQADPLGGVRDGDDDDDDENAEIAPPALQTAPNPAAPALATATPGAAAGPQEDEDDDGDNGCIIGRTDGTVGVSICTATLDEKSSAVHNLAQIGGSLGAAYLPFMAETLKIYRRLSLYPHENIRQEVAKGLELFVRAAIRAQPPAAPWEQGLPPPVALTPATKGVLEVVLAVLMRAMERDEDETTVAMACSTLLAVVEALGPAPLEAVLEPLCMDLLHLLQRQAPCQDADEDEDEEGAEGEPKAPGAAAGAAGEDEPEEDEPDDEMDHDPLLDDVTELICGLAKARPPPRPSWDPFGALGPAAFDRYYKVFFEELLKYAGRDRCGDDRSMALGAFADCAITMGPAYAPYLEVRPAPPGAACPAPLHRTPEPTPWPTPWPTPTHHSASLILPAACLPAPQRSMQVVLANLDSPDPGLQQNCVCCLGMLCRACPDLCTPHYGVLLARVGALLQHRVGMVADNALGAIGRMVRAAPGQVPLATVLPVLLDRLPLTHDPLENSPCFEALLVVLQDPTLRAQAAPFLERIVGLFARTVSAPPAPQLPAAAAAEAEAFAPVVATARPREDALRAGATGCMSPATYTRNMALFLEALLASGVALASRDQVAAAVAAYRAVNTS
ncbi:putative importin beta-2 subunit family protein [Paratrimastix pyriformis]|uniref:Importin beta-2 subunit family protein n=1 Tax=Paratrimastix pyriformis TaxID=342808 RepID=A0ABQ8UVJ9_9EUKA|nr:putative importin beta-2 subunit family protein [Paratrimastix pyriformis]